MEKIKFRVITENGLEEHILEGEKTGEVTEQIILDLGFQSHFANPVLTESANFFDTNKVCIKTTITSIEHPFQTKTEIDKIKVKIPFNGWIIVDGRPRLYRRSVTYRVYAEVCYPIDLLLQNVEKCSKQGAIAATVAAVSGNFAAATVAFQTAFLACMVFSDGSQADKIDIRVAGETEHGEWIPI